MWSCIQATTTVPLLSRISRPGSSPWVIIRCEPLSADLPADWAELAALATDEEKEIIATLASASVPLPEMGVETGGGIPLSFVWPGRRVAIALGLQDGEADMLADEGWTLIDPTADDLAAQVAALMGRD